jgi:hypothetical protein
MGGNDTIAVAAIDHRCRWRRRKGASANLYQAAVNRLCLLSGSTINGNLERRRTSNQQSTSTAARESNKRQQSQRMWEHNNQPKDQLQRRNQQEGGQRGSGKDDSEGG